MRQAAFFAGALFVLALVVRITSAPAPIEPSERVSLGEASLDETWTCPMHPEVLESAAGTCAMCKMNLVPIRLETDWSCPVHSFLVESGPGSCPLCRRDLVQMTVAVSWTCAGNPHIAALDRGTCPDGTPMELTRSLRPHGNHSPQHGGQFFMAADNWHHVEGAYPGAGVFQLHVYDDYSKPLGESELRHVKGRVVAGEVAFPLVASADGTHLEAEVGESSLPGLTAQVRFKDQGPEYRFDFAFSAPQWRAVKARPALTTARAGTVDAMLAQLHRLSEEIRDRIDNGAFADVYQPAFEAKDVALGLDEHRADLSASRRTRAGDALASLVRSAWLLDAFGDLGDRQQLIDGYAQFAASLDEVDTLFHR